MAFSEEEKKELTTPCEVEWSVEKGADSIETSINCDHVHGTKLFGNKEDGNQRSQSNMIISNEQTKSKVNLLAATCSANLAAVAAGSVITWSSPTLPKITKDGERIFITKEEGAWLSSLVALGACFGPFIASSMINKLGRKWTILCDMIVFLVSWSILLYSTHLYSLYFARILAGVAVGVVFTVLPLYIAEISPILLRGMLGSLMQFFLCIGFLISYVIGPFTSYSTLIMISGSVSFLCMILFIWVPESPHFLLSKDRKQEALEALYWFRGYPEKILLQTEIADILASVDEAKHNKGSIKVLFTDRGGRKALYYACTLAFFQQMSGINVVLFYAETIFDDTGSSISSSLSTIIIGLIMTSAAGLTVPAAKFFGVRNLLCLSAVGEGISLGALGLYFYLKNFHQDLSSLTWLPIASLMLFIISYSLGFGPFVWVIMAEIFPAHLKGIASAITASFCWFLAFVLTRYFSAFTDYFGQPAAFWMFSILCLLSLLFVVFQLPNTEGKSLQEIQEMISGKKKSDFFDATA